MLPVKINLPELPDLPHHREPDFDSVEMPMGRAASWQPTAAIVLAQTLGLDYPTAMAAIIRVFEHIEDINSVALIDASRVDNHGVETLEVYRPEFDEEDWDAE